MHLTLILIIPACSSRAKPYLSKATIACTAQSGLGLAWWQTIPKRGTVWPTKPHAEIPANNDLAGCSHPVCYPATTGFGLGISSDRLLTVHFHNCPHR
ncbi:hypothetical protein BZA77DRAFT_311295 [Pyronema omphalodes]|nr:hypothetical protein BZA77DRAFT_311295 [Pyronema omphalodes]